MTPQWKHLQWIEGGYSGAADLFQCRKLGLEGEVRSQSRPRKSRPRKSRLGSDSFIQHISNVLLLLMGCWGFEIKCPPCISRVSNMQMCVVNMQESQRLGGKPLAGESRYILPLGCAVSLTARSPEALLSYREGNGGTEGGEDLHLDGSVGKHPILPGHLSRDGARLVDEGGWEPVALSQTLICLTQPTSFSQALHFQ